MKAGNLVIAAMPEGMGTTEGEVRRLLSPSDATVQPGTLRRAVDPGGCKVRLADGGGVAVFCLVLLATAVSIAAFPAGVTSCHDGGACRVQMGQLVVKVRFAEINASKIYQPYGSQARDTLSVMIYGHLVDGEPCGTSYDRAVGLIRVQCIDTSEAMVRAGAAWDHARYHTDLATRRIDI